ncbi:MAG: hypothetical protein WCK86_17330 [Planctomycetia bacterium]
MKCRNVCHWMTVIAGMFIGAGACLQDYAQADSLVVNWGGNYVPPPPFHPLDFDEVANQVGANDRYGDPNPQGTYNGRLVDLNVPYNPYDAGYDTSATSAIFYGGHAIKWSDPDPGNPNTGFTNLSVENQGPSDAIQIEVKPNSGLQDYAALFFWKKENFLSGWNIISVNPNDLEFALRTTQVSNNKQTPDDIRWVVQNGTLFYVSEVVSGVKNNSEYSYDSGDLALFAWGLYDPTMGLADIFAPDPVIPLIDFEDLTDIQALGFYLEWGKDQATQNGGVDIKIKEFTVTHAPEPSFAMVGLFGFGLFAVRRLRSRRSQSSAISVEQSPTV